MAPTRLAIYDFDNTLFRSPVKPAGWSGGWWGRTESLAPPLVPEKPGGDWWNGSVVQRAKRDIGNPEVLAVLVTGRLASKFTIRIRDLLGQAGLRFDEVFLVTGGDTKAFKLKVIDQLLRDNLSIRGVDIWEDRAEHLREYADHVESKGKAAYPHLITVTPHEVLSEAVGSATVGTVAARVAARRIRAGVLSVGLFIPLPRDLAAKFPDLEGDPSPTHCTLLIVGDLDLRDEDRFLTVVRDQLSRWPASITAFLQGVNYFDNPDATVAYDRVRFDTDMARLRSDLASVLHDQGFPVGDQSPVSYSPHVTLAYMRPGSFGEYRGTVPEGSWTFNEVEVWCRDGNPVKVPLGGASPVRVAAKYQKKTEDDEGNTHYEYSERQIANRHREKAERVEHLRKNISDLRSRVKDDLKDEDPATRMTALVVALMDDTMERVGNDGSAEDGHFGVTGWQAQHVSFKGNTAVIKYTGKSGVDHEKVVDNGPIVTALKKLTKGRKGEDCLFETDEATVQADDVNDYLAEFDVTAKDIRGYRANDEMLKALKAERSKGPKELPKDRKERDEILKAEFKKALEVAAEAVGHEASTLRSQYLVPSLEETYVHDGTVLKSLKVATKTDAEREDEAVEELVKPAPPKKPPRHDLRKERLDLDDADTSEEDDDLSLNFKKVASRTLLASLSVRVATRWILAAKEDDAFKEYVEGKEFTNPETKKKVTFSTLEGSDSPAAQAVAKKIRKDWSKDREKDRKEPEEEPEDTGNQESSKRPTAPGSTEAIKKVMDEAEKVEVPESDSRTRQEMFKDALEGQPDDVIKDLSEQLGTTRKTNLERVVKVETGSHEDLAQFLKIPEGIYGEDKPKGTSFNPEESEKIIEKATKKRDRLQEQLGSVKEADKPDKIKELEAQNKSLNGMVAYHVGTVELIHALSEPKGSEDPRERLTEAASAYKKLPKDVAAKRKERAESDQKRLTDEVDKATEADKPGLQKKLDAANAEVTAAKFHEMTTSEGKGGGDDLSSKLVNKFKHLGAGSEHIQTLLLEGTKTKAGRKAMWNLASEMSDNDLVELAGDHAKGIDFEGLGPVETEFARKAILNRMMMAESSGTATEEEIDELVNATKGMAGTTEGKVDEAVHAKLKEWSLKTVNTVVPPKFREIVKEKVGDIFKKILKPKKAPAKSEDRFQEGTPEDGPAYRTTPKTKPKSGPKKKAPSWKESPVSTRTGTLEKPIPDVDRVSARFLGYSEGCR